MAKQTEPINGLRRYLREAEKALTFAEAYAIKFDLHVDALQGLRHAQSEIHSILTLVGHGERAVNSRPERKQPMDIRDRLASLAGIRDA